MTRVVFALERCAKTDPPDSGRLVWTDRGGGYYSVHLRDRKRWRDAGAWTLEPQPRVWYDQRLAESEEIAAGHIRVLAEAAEYVAAEHDSGAGEDDLLVQAAARLRAALDALTTPDTATTNARQRDDAQRVRDAWRKNAPSDQHHLHNPPTQDE